MGRMANTSCGTGCPIFFNEGKRSPENVFLGIGNKSAHKCKTRHIHHKAQNSSHGFRSQNRV